MFIFLKFWELRRLNRLGIDRLQRAAAGGR